MLLCTIARISCNELSNILYIKLSVSNAIGLIHNLFNAICLTYCGYNRLDLVPSPNFIIQKASHSFALKSDVHCRKMYKNVKIIW